MILRQWYTKYHPDSGPLQYAGAKELEDALGDELRREYGGFGADRLMTALGKRRKAVLVSHKACRTWCAQYGTKEAPTGSGAGSSSDPAVGRILKRPAAACATASAPPLKRPAAAASRIPTVSSRSASSSSSAPPSITSPAELEAACGKRYRAEVSDKGLGQTWGQMLQKVSIQRHQIGMYTMAKSVSARRRREGRWRLCVCTVTTKATEVVSRGRPYWYCSA